MERPAGSDSRLARRLPQLLGALTLAGAFFLQTTPGAKGSENSNQSPESEPTPTLLFDPNSGTLIFDSLFNPSQQATPTATLRAEPLRPTSPLTLDPKPVTTHNSNGNDNSDNENNNDNSNDNNHRRSRATATRTPAGQKVPTPTATTTPTAERCIAKVGGCIEPTVTRERVQNPTITATVTATSAADRCVARVGGCGEPLTPRVPITVTGTPMVFCIQRYPGDCPTKTTPTRLR